MHWSKPPAAPAIADHEVHLWLTMKSGALPVDALRLNMTDDERARARTLLHQSARELFMLAHAMLRDVLARYLGIEPMAIRLSRDAQGKPCLAKDHHSKLRFNLAHSGEAVLCGVAHGREIGVDIEAALPRADLLNVAAHFFAPDECAAVAACTSSNSMVELFYCLWTRKEAYLKARGSGLSFSLSAFSVLPAAGELGDFAIRCPDDDAQAAWRCRSLLTPRGYAAATVVDGPDSVVSCWRWSSV